MHSSVVQHKADKHKEVLTSSIPQSVLHGKIISAIYAQGEWHFSHTAHYATVYHFRHKAHYAAVCHFKYMFYSAYINVKYKLHLFRWLNVLKCPFKSLSSFSSTQHSISKSKSQPTASIHFLHLFPNISHYFIFLLYHSPPAPFLSSTPTLSLGVQHQSLFLNGRGIVLQCFGTCMPHFHGLYPAYQWNCSYGSSHKQVTHVSKINVF